MKSSVLILLFVTSVIATVESDNDLTYSIELAAPRGFILSLQNAPGVNSVSIWGAIYPGNSSIPLGQYTVDLILENGWWTYDNRNARLNPNDKFRISFIITKLRPDGREEITIQEKQYIVPANATRIGARVLAN